MSTLMGMVGFDTESASGHHVSFGTQDDDGNLLVQVTTYNGRDASKPLAGTFPQGQRILCQLSSAIFRVPPRGTRVLIAMPTGMEHVQGAGVIIATLERQPSARLGPAGDLAVDTKEDRVVLDYGPDTDIVISGRSVTIRSYENDFISLGGVRLDSGIAIQAADGSGAVFKPGQVAIFTAQDGTGNCCITLSDTDMKVGVPGSYMSLDAEGFLAFGKTASLKAAAVYLGAVPDPTSPVLWGATGAAGLPSPSVFVSKLV